MDLRALNHSLQSGQPDLATDTLRPDGCDAWTTCTSPDRLHCQGRTPREGGKQLLTSLFSRNLDLSVFRVHTKMPRAPTLLTAQCISPRPGASAWPSLQPHLPNRRADEPLRLSRERRVWVHSVVSDSCDPMGCSPPGSSVHGILQARILEWAATSFSRGSSRPRIEPASLTSPALAGGFLISSAIWATCRDT